MIVLNLIDFTYSQLDLRMANIFQYIYQQRQWHHRFDRLHTMILDYQAQHYQFA